MPFKRGEKRPARAGRKKGTPNKVTQLVQDKAQELGIDPFEVLLLFAAGDWEALGYDADRAPSAHNEYGTIYKWTIDPAVRARCASEACNYMLPKRKAVDIKMLDERGVELASKAAEFEKLPEPIQLRMLQDHVKMLQDRVGRK